MAARPHHKDRLGVWVVALATGLFVSAVGLPLAVAFSTEAPTGVATSANETFALDERAKLQVEILRSVRDSAQQRLSLFDDIAVTTAVTLLPSLILAMWFARSKDDKPIATSIYQTLPFLIAFFGAFILHTRTMALLHDSTLTRVQDTLATSLHYPDWTDMVPAAPVDERLIMTVRVTFYGIGMAILAVIYVASMSRAYEKQSRASEGRSRCLAWFFLTLHVLVLAGLLCEVAYVSWLWRRNQQHRDLHAPAAPAVSRSIPR